MLNALLRYPTMLCSLSLSLLGQLRQLASEKAISSYLLCSIKHQMLLLFNWKQKKLSTLVHERKLATQPVSEYNNGTQ